MVTGKDPYKVILKITRAGSYYIFQTLNLRKRLKSAKLVLSNLFVLYSTVQIIWQSLFFDLKQAFSSGPKNPTHRIILLLKFYSKEAVRRCSVKKVF